MQHLRTSFFYDLQELIRNAPLLRKYYYIFKALNLSALPDRNYGPGRTPICPEHVCEQHTVVQIPLCRDCSRMFVSVTCRENDVVRTDSLYEGGRTCIVCAMMRCNQDVGVNWDNITVVYHEHL